MDIKVVALLALAVTLAVFAEAHNHNRAPRQSRHVKRHLEEFLEPPPPPPGITPLHKVVRARRGNGLPPAGAAPAATPALSLGERIARWFYAGPSDGGQAKQHGHKGADNMMGLSPPPAPAPHGAPHPPVPVQHSAPPAPPPEHAAPHTAEAVALTEQKPPPPQHLDQHPSGTEHHSVGYQGGAQGYQGGSGQGGDHGYPQRPQNYPVLMPQSYLRTTDCNPCNNVPWIPMARAHGQDSGRAPQDSYGPPAAGEAWGQASDAVPLAHAPIPFPALHKNPLPPVFPADDFSHVEPAAPQQPLGLRDHLVPPTPEHNSVIFTINEERQPDSQDSNGDLELKSAPDQQHQGTLQHHHALHQVSPHGHHHVPTHAPHGQPLGPGAGPPQPQYLHNSFLGQQPYSAAKHNVELVHSVPIASYLASIEYPMTFIQSPLIEIPVKSVPAPAPAPAPSPAVQQSAPYQVVAPTPLSSPLPAHLETHAGSLPLQGEGPSHAPRLSDSAPAPSASIQHHNLPPCRQYHPLNDLHHQHHQHAVEDAATANSQNSHAYAQDVGRFESHKVRAEMTAAPTASTAAPDNHNKYRGVDEGSSPWPSTSAAPPTSPWEDQAPSGHQPSGQESSAQASVTANGETGYSAPSGLSTGPSAPAAHSKKAKQIQIIVPYTIDKESGQVRLHSELSPEELSGAGAEGLSFTAPPDMPLGPMGLPTGLEALVQQQGRKVPPRGPPRASPSPSPSPQQPQAQESVVVAELSPTPWQDKAPSPANPFAGLQHILAADLRSLLRNEEDSVDRLRLQKNIDNWTAQEYSSLKATRDTEGQETNPGMVAFNFTSTTASVGTSSASSSSSSSLHGKLNPSKKIPKEYLTTTPLSVSSASTRAATKASTSTPTTTTKPTTSRRKEGLEPTKRPAKIHHIRKNATRDDRKTKNGWTLVDNLVVAGPTTTTPRTTAATPDNHRPTHDQTRAPWERLQVSISPLTKEKVYVVTPQSTTGGEVTTEAPVQSTTAAMAVSETSKSINDLSPFRQWMDVPTTSAAPPRSTQPHTRPRFSIRPTPGWPKARPHGFRSTAERLTGAETTTSTTVEKGVTKPSRATPRGFAVETISGHSKVFTATTSTWSKKKAVDSDNKKSTTAKPTTISGSVSTGGVSRTTRALKAAVVTPTPKRGDLSDIDAEASASVLHRHVAQLSPLGAAPKDVVADLSTTTSAPSTVSPGTEDDAETPSGPEIVIVEGKREKTSTTTLEARTVTTSPPTTEPTTTPTTETTLPTTESTLPTTAADTDSAPQRTTRAIKTIGRRPDGSRYILSDEEVKLQHPAQALQAQRTKLQVVSTPKKYESPPPRPKPQKGPAALFRRKPSRRPPHLVMTPDRGSYLWNFSEFSGTSHEDMAEDDMSAIKGVVVELKKESSAATSTAAPTTVTPTPTTSTPTPAPTPTTPVSSTASSE